MYKWRVGTNRVFSHLLFRLDCGSGEEIWRLLIGLGKSQGVIDGSCDESWLSGCSCRWSSRSSSCSCGRCSGRFGRGSCCCSCRISRGCTIGSSSRRRSGFNSSSCCCDALLRSCWFWRDRFWTSRWVRRIGNWLSSKGAKWVSVVSRWSLLIIVLGSERQLLLLETVAIGIEKLAAWQVGRRVVVLAQDSSIVFWTHTAKLEQSVWGCDWNAISVVKTRLKVTDIVPVIVSVVVVVVGFVHVHVVERSLKIALVRRYLWLEVVVVVEELGRWRLRRVREGRQSSGWSDRCARCFVDRKLRWLGRHCLAVSVGVDWKVVWKVLYRLLWLRLIEWEIASNSLGRVGKETIEENVLLKVAWQRSRLVGGRVVFAEEPFVLGLAKASWNPSYNHARSGIEAKVRITSLGPLNVQFKKCVNQFRKAHISSSTAFLHISQRFPLKPRLQTNRTREGSSSRLKQSAMFLQGLKPSQKFSQLTCWPRKFKQTSTRAASSIRLDL